MEKLSLSERILSMKPSATLKMAQAARELIETGVDVCVLSVGEPDFATDPSICQIAKSSLDEGKTHYSPVRGNKAMIEAMQKKFARDQKVKYEKNEVMCTVGAKAAILYALQSIINPGDEVILLAPYWVSYKEHLKLVGATPVIVETQLKNNFMPTAEEIKSAISHKTKAIILNSPNCPTGAVITESSLREIAKVLLDGKIWLISDEIYEKLLFKGATHISPASISEDMKKRTVVISGASKGYAMTGWRVGVVGAHKDIIECMAKIQGQDTTCLPDFVQDAAAYALAEGSDVSKAIKSMVLAYAERKDFALKRLKNIPDLTAFEPEGAFYIWVDASKYIGRKTRVGSHIKDDMELAELLLHEAHVAVISGTPFGGTGYLRLSIASSIENISLGISRIDNLLKNTYV